MTNPRDETQPLEDALTDEDLVQDPDDELGDDDLSAQSWKLLAELRRRAVESRPANPSGPEAWEHVELLLDLAIAERAQRTVDRIVKRRRA